MYETIYKREPIEASVAKERLLNGNATDISGILQTCIIPDSVINDPEVQKAVRESVNNTNKLISSCEKMGQTVDRETKEYPNLIKKFFKFE